MVTFPETLHGYWPTQIEMIEALEPLNTDHVYFDSRATRARVDSGNLIVHKNLFLHWLGENMAPLRILEIGTRTGKSLCSLLVSHPSPRSVTVTSVDPYIEECGSPKEVNVNLAALDCAPSHIEFVQEESGKALPAMTGQLFNYILIDGSHAHGEVAADMRHSWDLLAPLGVLVLDDYKNLHGQWAAWVSTVEASTRVYEQEYAFAVAAKW